MSFIMETTAAQHHVCPQSHIRDTTLQRIQNKKTRLWQDIIKNDTLSLPIPFIWLYDEAGNLVGRKYYTDSPPDASDVSETTSMTCSDTVKTDGTNVEEMIKERTPGILGQYYSL